MAQVVGYGNGNTNVNVFAFYVDADLSSLITYHAVDNADFPTTGALTTVTNEIFTSNSHASGSCICLIDTTSGTQATSDWQASIPADTTQSNPNRLKGAGTTTGNWYVEQDGDILTEANYSATTRRAKYNMVIQVPSTATTADNFRFDLMIKYSYVGTAPTPQFEYNSGTEGAPTWTDITVDTEGVYHTRTGASAGAYYANIPESGVENTTEAHVA